MVIFVPNTPVIVGGIITLISLATYFSLRIASHDKLPLIVTCCVSLFLLSSVLSGFNFLNLLLIVAIGTLASSLTTNHQPLL